MKSVKNLILIISTLSCLVLVYSLSYHRFSYKKVEKKQILNNKKEENKNEYLKGIDLSHHQGKINWTKEDSKIFSFAFIKSTEGCNFKDKLFHYNFHNLRKNGIYVGAYHVYRFNKGGKEQAKNFISVVPNYKNNLPPAVDLHFISEVKSDQKIKTINELRVFLNMLYKHYGKKPVLYISHKDYNKYILGHFKNEVWVYHYTLKTEPKKLGNKKFKFWQYGVISKKSNKYKKYTKDFSIDVNYFNGTLKDLKSYIK